jgi:hypothetical protein
MYWERRIKSDLQEVMAPQPELLFEETDSHLDTHSAS